MENPDNAVETTPMLGGNTENRQIYENHKCSRWSRIKYYIPILSWLPQYSLSNLKFDILSGLTISFILIPQGLSYAANLIKINPIYGLYSCIVPVIVYLFLGTSRQISIGPEAVISIMTGSTITEYIRRNAADFPEDIDIMAERAQLAFLITAIVGVLTLIFGLFRLGFLDSVLSRALLTGFTSAVATVIIFEQIPLLLGITSTCDITSPLEKFIYIIKNYTEKESHTITMYISLACLSFLIIVSIIKKIFSNRLSIQRIPEVLLLVGSSIAISYYYDWEDLGVKVLGKIN